MIRKFHRSLALLCLVGLAACSRPSYSLSPNPTPYIFTAPTEYYLYIPSTYAPDKDWPLFVGIHGSGRDGTQCLKMWQGYAESEGFVLVCPSLADEHGGWYMDEAEGILRKIIQQVRKDCRVQKQFFLTGFSAGAEFAQVYAFVNPKSIKALAILSSANYYEPPSAAHHIPFLVVIGDQDNPTSVENARLFADLLRQNQYSIELDILPGVGHKVTPQALELTMDLYHRLEADLP